MSEQEDFPDGEFTRFKGKVQLGDGPDQRGEITVETVRHNYPNRIFEVGGEDPDDEDGDEVTLPNGETVSVALDSALFAEWYMEMGRSTDALREQLGLDDEEEP